MKKIYLLLLIITCCLNLTSQNIVNGVLLGQKKAQFHNSPLGDCDTIFSFSTLDTLPAGLAFDGHFIYTNATISDSIYKFNLDGQLLGSIPSPANSFQPDGGDLDFDGTFLWVVVEQEGRLYKIDPTNGDIINSFKLPTSNTSDPNNFGCAHDNGYIWITEYIDETLIRIDTVTGHVIDSFAINRTIAPIKIINGDLYGLELIDHPAIGPMQLVKFDRTNGSIIDSIPWCLPYSLGFCWAEDHLWGLSSGNSYGTNRIYEFDSMLISINNIVPIINSVSVFPNPTTSKVVVSSLIKMELIEIYNMNGIKVYSKHNSRQQFSNEIDFSNYQKGIYIVKIFDGVKIHTEKIVVQ